jgi:hypothetical protein
MQQAACFGRMVAPFSGSLFPDGCPASRLPEIQTFEQTSRLPLIFALAVPFACYS